MSQPHEGLRAALAYHDSSVRLQAALTAGTHPLPEYLDVLVERCAVEPDFYVREMLTWALVRQEATATVDRLLVELRSDAPQARSQALHTLSKIGDGRAWPALTEALLLDDDDEVARAAWRTAAGLAPVSEQPALARTLAGCFGRGGREVQLSLSRAFIELGPAGAEAVHGAMLSDDRAVRVHAYATDHLMRNPEDGFDSAVADAEEIA